MWCLILKSVALWFTGVKCLLFFYARRDNREKCKGKQEKNSSSGLPPISGMTKSLN